MGQRRMTLTDSQAMSRNYEASKVSFKLGCGEIVKLNRLGSKAVLL